MIIQRYALGAAALFLAACQAPVEAPAAPSEAAEPIAVTAPQPTTDVAVEAAAVPEPTEACAVIESRDWAAWVNRMPGPGATPSVHVSGKVDVRTGGYSFTWEEGPLDRSTTPALRLKLVPKAPDGMATQAITTEEVKYQAPALSAAYSRVIISCGSAVLAEIPQIDTVQ